MKIGGALLLIAVGAILKFAVTKRVSGIDLSTVGVVLMIVGAVGLVLTLILMTTRRRTDVISTPGRTCGCRKSRPRSCGGRVFVDDAAGAVVSADSEGVGVGDGRWCRLEGCRLVEGSVRAVLVVMGLVLAENPQ